MTKRRLILLLLVCVIAAGALALLWPEKREPRYNGITLTEWIILHERWSGRNSPLGSRWVATSVLVAPFNPDEPPLQETEKAVHQIGTNALPWLLEWIQCERASWRYKASSATEKVFGSDSPFAYDWCEDPGWIKEQVALAGFEILRTNAGVQCPN